MAMSRRLAAIMFTDIAGFTLLTHTDEAGALRLLREHEELVGPILETHRGRKVKSMGDGLLIEFPNALDAVECGVDLQRSIHERNAREGKRPLLLRVGIHLGDVQGLGTDIFGDAVNIASRVEPLAEPGGVCLSEPVYVQVRNKVPYQLEKLGPKTLKGVQEPVDIFRVVLPWTLPEVQPEAPGPTRLAVLPFANISPDPHDEYFADGLTEELITILSQLHELRVIARTSVIQYRSAPKPISQIGTDLGVSSILEGSVRKAGAHLRITVQLIDVRSQEHTWADTYDRKLEDVFAVQTEVAKRIAEALRIKLRRGEEARLEERPALNPDSYLAYLRGRSLLGHSYSEQTLRNAKKQLELAVSIDPSNARAYSGLSDASYQLGWFHFDERGTEWNRATRAYADRAIELDPHLSEAHCSLARILWYEHEFVATEQELKLAISLNPSYSVAHELYAKVLEDEGRTDDALREFSLAEELDPRSGTILTYSAWLLVMLRRLDQAKIKLDRLKELYKNDPMYHGLLANYYLAKEDFPQALRAADRRVELEGTEPNTLHARIYAAAGEKRKARKLLGDLEGKSARVAAPEKRAQAYAILGDLDECFRLLNEAFEDHDLPFQMWRNEPSFEPVRRDPRFAGLLKKMKLT